MEQVLPGAIVAAVSYPGRVIGREGKLPWKLPLELRLFRSLTWGGVLVMGRRTWESIGRPLAGREIWVWSRGLEVTPPPAPPHERAGAEMYPSVRAFPSEQQLIEALLAVHKPIFYVGGAQLFAWALPRVRWMYLTWIYGDFPGEVTFPPFSEEDWEAVAWEYFTERCVPFVRVQYVRR